MINIADIKKTYFFYFGIYSIKKTNQLSVEHDIHALDDDTGFRGMQGEGICTRVTHMYGKLIHLENYAGVDLPVVSISTFHWGCESLPNRLLGSK